MPSRVPVRLAISLLLSLGACSQKASPRLDGPIGVLDVARDGPAGEGGAVDAIARDAGAKDAAGDLALVDAAREGGAPGSSFSFVVWGDSHFDTSHFDTKRCTAGLSERLAIPEVVLSLSPAFVLHAGDLVDQGDENGAYATFAACNAKLLARVPLFPTAGNHDADNGGMVRYKAFLTEQLLTRNAAVYGPRYGTDFALAFGDDPTVYSTDFSQPSHLDTVPSGVSFGTFYAFRYGNAYFLSLEVPARDWCDTPKPWIEKHLQAARADASIAHVFVFLHQPLYSTTTVEQGTGDEGLAAIRQAYEALFRQYGVTVVFSGHKHLYDRFYVPDDGSPTRAYPPPARYPHDAKAVHYIVTGGGGSDLNSCGWIREKSYDYYQNRGCLYEVIRVEVEGARLRVSAIAVTGSAASPATSVYDTFTIE